MAASALRRRALLSGTMLVAAVAGYGRRAYAACVITGGSTYLCSGANVAPQTITANNATVSTVAGFSVNAAGRGVSITGNGALSFTDTNASPLTGSSYGLYLSANNNNGGTPASVTVNTNGALTGGNMGLFAFARATGGVDITVNGDVTGTTSGGIRTRAYGGGVSLTTGASTTVRGTYGIRAGNSGIGVGTGALTITINGDVSATASNDSGIIAYNAGTGGLSVTTAAGTTVSGGGYGIAAGNSAGASTITINGNVTGTNYSGIYAGNSGTNLSVTTGAGTDGQRRHLRHLCAQLRHGRADHHRQRQCHRHQW